MLADKAVRENTAVSARGTAKLPAEKLIYWLLGFLVCYVIVRGVAGSATRPIGFDELITLAVASQPSAKDIWDSLAQAVDSHPPLFYLVEKAALGAVNNEHIAIRLLSILALPCTIICVFAYIRGKNTERIAFLGAALLLLTSLYQTYFIEARAYSMVIACIAFGLVCYQRVPSLFWATMLGLSLALAESLHYYAMFSMLPFWVAEFVYSVCARRFRWSVWAALVFGFAPLLFFWRLLANLRAYYGAHIWTHYRLSSIPATYGSLVFTGGALGFAVIAVCVAAIVAGRLLPVQGVLGEGVERDPVEAALLLALLALPFPTALAANLMNGAMVERYVLATTLGIVLSLACALSLARKGVVALFALFVLSTVGVHELSFWRSAHSLSLKNPTAMIEEFVQTVGHPDLPVVIPDGLLYLEIAYYTSPKWKDRFIYLEDQQKATQYLATDSVDKNLVVLRRYMPLHVNEFSEFVSRNPRFLLYVEQTGAQFDWLTGYLPGVASSVQALVLDPHRSVYLVTMKENSSR
jgi:hypothetical protein